MEGTQIWEWQCNIGISSKEVQIGQSVGSYWCVCPFEETDIHVDIPTSC